MLEDLYQELILDHAKNPRNNGSLEEYTHYSQGFNPLCGDRLKVYLNLENDAINNLAFDGDGCAISVAASSLLLDKIKKMTKENAEGVINTFRKLVIGEEISSEEEKSLDKLMIFANINNYPSRVKCAILGGHAILAALKENEECTTE